LGAYGKEDHGSSKKIRLSTTVPDPRELLWGHVAKGALVALQFVLSIFDNGRGKTKISYFNIEILI